MTTSSGRRKRRPSAAAMVIAPATDLRVPRGVVPRTRTTTLSPTDGLNRWLRATSHSMGRSRSIVRRTRHADRRRGASRTVDARVPGGPLPSVETSLATGGQVSRVSGGSMARPRDDRSKDMSDIFEFKSKALRQLAPLGSLGCRRGFDHPFWRRRCQTTFGGAVPLAHARPCPPFVRSMRTLRSACDMGERRGRACDGRARRALAGRSHLFGKAQGYPVHAVCAGGSGTKPVARVSTGFLVPGPRAEWGRDPAALRSPAITSGPRRSSRCRLCRRQSSPPDRLPAVRLRGSSMPFTLP